MKENNALFDIVRVIDNPVWSFSDKPEYCSILNALGVKYETKRGRLSVKFNGNNKAVKAFRLADITDRHTVQIDGRAVSDYETYSAAKIERVYHALVSGLYDLSIETTRLLEELAPHELDWAREYGESKSAFIARVSIAACDIETMKNDLEGLTALADGEPEYTARIENIKKRFETLTR